jgi:hypothetical protein
MVYCVLEYTVVRFRMGYTETDTGIFIFRVYSWFGQMGLGCGVRVSIQEYTVTQQKYLEHQSHARLIT